MPGKSTIPFRRQPPPRTVGTCQSCVLKGESGVFVTPLANMPNIIKKLTNKAFHRRKPGAEDRSRPHSSLDVPSPSYASAPRSTAPLNDSISGGAIPPAVPNKSQDAALLNPRTVSQRSSAHSRVDTANQALVVPGTIEKIDRPRSEEHSTSYSDAFVKAGSIAWKGLETALRLLERSADAFPPLKLAIGGLVACLDLAGVIYCFCFHLVDSSF